MRYPRRGAPILFQVQFRRAQADLGGEIEMLVMGGTRATGKIPAGAKSWEQSRLCGQGFSVLRSATRGACTCSGLSIHCGN